MKPDDVNIKSITTADANTVFGLGEDNIVYRWNAGDHTWLIHAPRLDPEIVGV